MEDREQSAFVAGFLEGIKHYAYWRGDKQIVGLREVPIDEALKYGEKEALYYFEEYQKARNENR